MLFSVWPNIQIRLLSRIIFKGKTNITTQDSFRKDAWRCLDRYVSSGGYWFRPGLQSNGCHHPKCDIYLFSISSIVVQRYCLWPLPAAEFQKLIKSTIPAAVRSKWHPHTTTLQSTKRGASIEDHGLPSIQTAKSQCAERIRIGIRFWFLLRSQAVALGRRESPLPCAVVERIVLREMDLSPYL